MPHQIFVSYATEDADSARLLCRVLEAEEGIRCWIAPRDVRAGTDYAAAILDAIRSAQLVVLVFSAYANDSPYVLREIERAVAYERAVVSLRLDNTTPNPSLEYYLNLWQWLEAPRGIESNCREIVTAVRQQLARGGDPDGRAQSEPGVSLSPAATPTVAIPHRVRPPEGERRFVTAVSASISDFASFSERLDPEDLYDLVTACFERLALSIERFGGTVDTSANEGIKAVFGAPKAHEDDVERALHATLEMRDALTSFNKGRSVPVAVHFGVSTGLVYARKAGSGERRDYSIVGDAVSAADRLKDLAEPGEILAGPDTYRQAGHLFAWRPVGHLETGDRPDAPAFYRLVGILPISSGRNVRHGRGLTSPLVGREPELASILGRLARLREGEGGIVLLIGEAGLGKSRLVAEAQVKAQQTSISWLEGQALSFGRSISYWPLLEIMHKDTDIQKEDPESERWAKLALRVGGLFGEERNEILPYLGTLLGVSLPEELAQKVRSLDGETMSRQVYRATRQYFARMAQLRPTVVVFEDVHWLDGSTAALLEHLLPLTGQVPILFVLVSRPETESALTALREVLHKEHGERLSEIVLKPLSPEESVTLARNLAHIDELPAYLRDAILDKAEGNPFFVEEVVRSLVDIGGLVQDATAGGWQITEQASSITIPGSLRGLIMARVDCLDDDLKRVLRLASVAGHDFAYRVLSDVAAGEYELDQCLAALEARELIVTKVRGPEVEYAFKHSLVQEVTYDTTPLGRRKDLHAQVAGAIERVFAERLEEFYSLLAYHYSKSEHWDRARDYLLKAGGQASNLGAGEAGNSYQQALEALLKGCDLRSGEDGSTQAIDWFLDGVGAFYDATHLASIRPALEIFHARATATFGPVDRRTLAAAEMLGAAYAEQYMFPEARAVLESTLHTRESLGDSDDPSLARLLRMLAMVAASQDRYEEADTLLSHALALQTAASDCDYNMLTEIYMGLLYVYNYSDRGLRRAAEVAERALTISELRQTPMYPVLLANICDLEMRRGRLAQAEAHARMGVEAARSWLYEGYCRGNLGDILMCQGRCYDALPELQQATDAMDTLGRSADLGSLLGILAECQLRLGQLEAAEESARRAINLLEKEPGADRASAAWAWRALAGVQLNRGALQDAERSIEKAASCLTEAYHEGEPFFEAELLFRQAQVRLKQGRGQEGQGDFARALELLTELGGEEHERKKVIQAQWETSMNRNGWAG